MIAPIDAAAGSGLAEDFALSGQAALTITVESVRLPPDLRHLLVVASALNAP